ncbi:gamma-glutamyl-gamma-aminobutyrate hydrolase family protein [Tahibacter amnicola]|uniref:Gamma-glutamyl-gamma-aminobutyrate hydrolase family protein n=1 Tax=Tahibacter amnicola TaxID=2976241 RepID=A0ABY6BGU4_9GAMM|nr:gamma-glutamyl-gamma-aminobutyrate hydrolase family protein [Tahibacter amnicola]UXI67826.1 gamma-glutamyl-gamma-aminobutyrate hydrolase family protein [Tahibacter amnicola]
MSSPGHPLRVGITARLVTGDPAAGGARRKDMLAAERDLIDAIARAGALPLILPWTREGQLPIAAIVEGIDALVLQGGADVAPESYAQAPLRSEWTGDATRDAFELQLLRGAVAHGLPVLGICRGCQLINVAYGGTLFQDLAQLRARSRCHSQPLIYERHHHAVALAAGGLLESLYGRQQGGVVSAHHQGIDRLGDGLKPEAWCAEDGLVEAVRAESGWVLGLQWHPEFRAPVADALDFAPLMDTFLAAAMGKWSLTPAASAP